MFLSTINQQTRDEVYNIAASDVNEQWRIFSNTFSNIFNHSLTVKRVHYKKNLQKYLKMKRLKNVNKGYDTLRVLASSKNQLFKVQYNPVMKDCVTRRLLINELAKSYENRVKASDNKT